MVLDNSWINGDNWGDPGTLPPGGLDVVIIPSGLATYPTLNSSIDGTAYFCYDMIVEDGADITFEGATDIRISNDFISYSNGRVFFDDCIVNITNDFLLT